jgi:hypothetical protein
VACRCVLRIFFSIRLAHLKEVCCLSNRTSFCFTAWGLGVHLNDPFSDTCAVATEFLVVESALVKFVVAHACVAVRVFSRCVLTSARLCLFSLHSSLSTAWRFAFTGMACNTPLRTLGPSGSGALNTPPRPWKRSRKGDSSHEPRAVPRPAQTCARAHVHTHTRTSWRGARKRQCKKPTSDLYKEQTCPSQPLKTPARPTSRHLAHSRHSCMAQDVPKVSLPISPPPSASPKLMNQCFFGGFAGPCLHAMSSTRFFRNGSLGLLPPSRPQLSAGPAPSSRIPYTLS